MNHPSYKIFKNTGRNLAVMLLAFSAVVTFASLGEGKKPRSEKPASSLLSTKSGNNAGSFSLKSGYTYRGNQVFNVNGEKKFIRLNTVVTTQKGNTTYIVPLKKNVILENLKISLGNRQFTRN